MQFFELYYICWFLFYFYLNSIHVNVCDDSVTKAQLKPIIHVIVIIPVSVWCTGAKWWQPIKISQFSFKESSKWTNFCSFQCWKAYFQSFTMGISVWKAFNKTLYVLIHCNGIIFIAPTWIATDRRAYDPFLKLQHNRFYIFRITMISKRIHLQWLTCLYNKEQFVLCWIELASSLTQYMYIYVYIHTHIHRCSVFLLINQVVACQDQHLSLRLIFKQN